MQKSFFFFNAYFWAPKTRICDLAGLARSPGKCRSSMGHTVKTLSAVGFQRKEGGGGWPSSAPAWKSGELPGWWRSARQRVFLAMASSQGSGMSQKALSISDGFLIVKSNQVFSM